MDYSISDGEGTNFSYIVLLKKHKKFIYVLNDYTFRTENLLISYTEDYCEHPKELKEKILSYIKKLDSVLYQELLK